MFARSLSKALFVSVLLALAPAAAQDRRATRIGTAEANAVLARAVNVEALNRSFRALSEYSYRDLRRANLATLSAPTASPQAMVMSASAECQFTITKSYNPLPPAAGAAFTITTRIENTGAACNQPNGVYFYDYQSQTNVTSTSNHTPVNLSLTPTAHFFLVEPNPAGMNQSTTYLNPWRVDIFQFSGSIPPGWVFQFERQLTAVTAPTAPNAVEWPNSPPITYSCMFGAHQLNFDIGASSSATNSGGYDYKECGVAQMTTCIPIAQLPDLDAWWRFDEDSTDSVLGITVSGGTYVSGYVGQARTGAGSAPDHAVLDLGQGDFTVDFWINVPNISTGTGDFYFRKRDQAAARVCQEFRVGAG